MAVLFCSGDRSQEFLAACALCQLIFLSQTTQEDHTNCMTPAHLDGLCKRPVPCEAEICGKSLDCHGFLSTWLTEAVIFRVLLRPMAVATRPQTLPALA